MTAHQSANLTPARRLGVAGPRRWGQMLILTLLFGAAVLLGRDLVHHINTLEAWIEAQGWLGWFVFIAATAVCTSCLVPDTCFAVIAGAVFGWVWGACLMVIACLLTAAADFVLARVFLQRAVQGMISRQPRLATIQQAVNHEGFRFQFLLRLTPTNPVVLNYVLGAGSTPFHTFFAALIGLIPALVVEVYFGHAARHAAAVVGGVSQHSTAHTVFTLAGLVVCVGVLLYVTRLARQALETYDQTSADPKLESAHGPET